MLNHEEKYFTKLANVLNINVNDAETIKANDPIKKKNKQFSLITAKIGLFIISKPKIRRKTKIKYFVSYLDIYGFDFPAKNTIGILYKNASYYNNNSEDSLVMEMANESALQTFTVTVVDLYLRFSSDSPNFKLLIFANPPFNILQQPKLINDENNTVLRYYSACAKYQQTFDNNTKDLFEEYHIPNDLYVMQFNDRCQMPIHYKTIALPLIHASNLRLLKFDGFAPKNICKIVYYILKHNHRITTIIMKNYHNLDFAFFNFANLENPSVVSWTFSNCNFDEPSQQWQFFNQFQDYKGNIQKLTIDRFKFPILYAERITEIIRNSYCFRTLEVLEITRPEISQSNSSEVDTVFNYFQSIVPSLKVLQKISFTNFEIRPSISKHNDKFTRIIETTSLKHIQMSNIDFRKATNSIQFPSSINTIEFTHCSFNSTSLINLLKGSSEVRPPLVLNLSAMQIEQTELNIYYKNSHEIPQLSNLIELNYSKNFISPSFIPEFCRIFLPSGIKFLSINNCFGPQQLTPVLRIFNHLSSNTTIHGIELRGGRKETTFGPIMRALLPGLQKVQTLIHIDISNQNWYSSLKNDIYAFIHSMKDLKNFISEGAGFPTLEVLSMYYTTLIDNTTLCSVGNPIKDIEMMPKNEENQRYYTSSSFQKLKMRLRSKILLSTRYTRSCYYFRYTDITKFYEFIQKFPVTLFNFENNKWLNEFISYNHQQFSIRTLLDLDMSEIGNESLSDFQLKFIESPIDEVEVKTQDLTQFQFPEKLKTYLGTYDSKFASNLTRPTIQNKVNAKEVMAKYRGWICKKNQRLFRNLSIASNLFDKVYEEELRGMILSMSKMNEEFGKNIPILEPPTYVSSEAIKVISMQLDTFGVNEGSDSEENTSHNASHNQSHYGSGSMSESGLSNYSSSQLFATYDERKSYSRTNSSDNSSFTSDGDENSYSRSSSHLFNTYNPRYTYNNNDSSLNVPLMSPLASSYDDSSIQSMNRSNSMGRGKSRRTRKMVNSSAVASDVLYLSKGYGLNSFDSEYYEIHNENDEDDYNKSSKRRRNNKGATDFTTLDVLQYAVSPSQELTISPKQLDSLKRIRDSATFLASYRPIRQIPIRRMPEKAVKVDTRLPELFDTLIGTSRQLCKTILQQDVLSPKQQSKEDDSNLSSKRDSFKTTPNIKKKRSKTASLMPYMIEDIVLDSKIRHDSSYDDDEYDHSSVISARSSSLRSLPSKTSKAVRQNFRAGTVSSFSPPDLTSVLVQSSSNTKQTQKHATIDQQAKQSCQKAGALPFSAPQGISPLNISQNPFSQITQQKAATQDKQRSGTFPYSPPSITPLNILQNPLSQLQKTNSLDKLQAQAQPQQQQQQEMSLQQQFQQHQAHQQSLQKQQQTQQPPQQQQHQQSLQQQFQQLQAQQQSLMQNQQQTPQAQQQQQQSQQQQHQTQLQSLMQQQQTAQAQQQPQHLQQQSLQQQFQQHQMQQQQLQQQQSLQQQLQQHQMQQQQLQAQQQPNQAQQQQQSLQQQSLQQQLQQHQPNQAQQQQQSLQQQLQQHQMQQQQLQAQQQPNQAQQQQQSLQQQLQQHQMQQQQLQAQQQQQSLQQQLQQQQMQQQSLQQRLQQQQKMQQQKYQQQSLQQQLQQRQMQQQQQVSQQAQLQQQRPQNPVQSQQSSLQKAGSAPFSAPSDSPLKGQNSFAPPSILQPPQKLQPQSLQQLQQMQQHQHQQPSQAQQQQLSLQQQLQQQQMQQQRLQQQQKMQQQMGNAPQPHPNQPQQQPIRASTLPGTPAPPQIHSAAQANQQRPAQPQMTQQQQQQYMQRQQQQQQYMQRQQQLQQQQQSQQQRPLNQQQNPQQQQRPLNPQQQQQHPINPQQNPQMMNQRCQQMNQRPTQQPPNVQMPPNAPIRGTMPVGASIHINPATPNNNQQGAAAPPPLNSQHQTLQSQQQQQQMMRQQYMQRQQQQQKPNTQAPPK